MYLHQQYDFMYKHEYTIYNQPRPAEPARDAGPCVPAPPLLHAAASAIRPPPPAGHTRVGQQI